MDAMEHGHDFAFGTSTNGMCFDFDGAMLRSWEEDDAQVAVEEAIEQTSRVEKERLSESNYIGWQALSRQDLCSQLRAREAAHGKAFRSTMSNSRMTKYTCNSCCAFVQIQRGQCGWHVVQQRSHEPSCGTRSRTATSDVLLANDNIVRFVSRFRSRLCVDLDATRDMIAAEGFLCAKPTASPKEARKAATRYAKIVANKVFEVDDAPEMLAKLRCWVNTSQHWSQRCTQSTTSYYIGARQR